MARKKPVRLTRPAETDGGGRQPEAAYGVLALIGSAGGTAAIASVLCALPEGYPVPVIVMQHFPEDAPQPLRYVTRSLPFKVEWARDGAALTAGVVLVTPPRSFLEILPDGTCALSPCPRGPMEKPMDRLFRSLARSFGPRAIGVVLSGLMDDGAAGACEMRLAGASVIAQSEADYGEMPNATVRCGGADVSLRVEQIGELLVEIAAGVAIPRSPTELEAVEAVFAGRGPARAAMRAVNWTSSPLGPVRSWSQSLATTVKNAMSSSFATCIYWGPDLVQIYNEAFLPFLGARPSPAGRPARLTWTDLWTTLGRTLESVFESGEGVHVEDQLFPLEHDGVPTETYVTCSHSPLRESDGSVCGVLATVIDSTRPVVSSRRLEILRSLAAMPRGESALRVAENSVEVLEQSPLDFPFALLYLLDRSGRRATLAASVGLEGGKPGAPHQIILSEESDLWPLHSVVRRRQSLRVDDLAARLPGRVFGLWPEPVTSARMLPLSCGAEGRLVGVVIIGISPRLGSDPANDEFQLLIAQHISAALGEAEVRRLERERSDYLAELDRAKIDFFSNVSHEFRTPLTLLLAPLEEMLARRASLPEDLADPIEAATRNGRQLLALVNTLLDFSHTEALREHARFESMNLAELTTDIASVFRTAVEAGGLHFEVSCQQDMPSVAVDRQMWEKIVSNLLSNALKFTFQGAIRVHLRSLELHAELVVSDTGVGIPEHEVPHLFKRFHRVRGVRARTAEGSGIGLWMVDDLVKRMGGQLRVRSKVDGGTTFTIWIPFKTVRAAAAQAQPSFLPVGPCRPEFATEVARNASRWVVSDVVSRGGMDDIFGPPSRDLASLSGTPARILVIDDNADMRAYLRRLLSPHWLVDTATDGVRGLEAALSNRFDLILADVTMPGVDGFQLLERLRQDDESKYVPVVLVTARAGESAAIEGLRAGANDYVVKPFSPRELVARVAAVAERSRTEAALRASQAELTSRNQELERFDRATVGQELRIVELKRQVNELRARLFEPPSYPLGFDAEGDPGA